MIKKIIYFPLVIEVNLNNQGVFKGQAKQLFNAISSKQKQYYLFTRQQAAQAHCQMGAIALSNEIIFAWLNKIFHVKQANQT